MRKLKEALRKDESDELMDDFESERLNEVIVQDDNQDSQLNSKAEFLFLNLRCVNISGEWQKCQIHFTASF